MVRPQPPNRGSRAATAGTRRAASLAVLGVIAFATLFHAMGCVAVPPEIRADFAPDDGVRPNHYRLKPGWKPGSRASRAPGAASAPEGGR